MQAYLSVAAFARRHNVTRACVYLWIDANLIPTKHIAGVIRIPVTAKRPKTTLGRPTKDVVFA